MNKLIKLISDHREWLSDRVQHHVEKYHYAEYFLFSKEDWRTLTSRLSGTLLEALERSEFAPESYPFDQFADDPIASFVTAEVERYRSRNVPLSMFLGLMKHYRQSYIDLIREWESDLPQDERDHFELIIDRSFDGIELALIDEWQRADRNEQMEVLRSEVRRIANERNKYLAAFEYQSSPIILFDKTGDIENLNHAALELFSQSDLPRTGRYHSNPGLEGMSWLLEGLSILRESGHSELRFERRLDTNTGPRYYEVIIRRIPTLDQEFNGTVVILEDISDQKKITDELRRINRQLQNEIVEREKIERELKRMAVTDELTGLYNRRRIFDMLELEFLRSNRYGRSFAFCIIDIDHFKRVNDTLGHLTGDEVLKQLAELLLMATRRTDVVGRYGGEEFSILLVGTDLDGAYEYAEKIRQTVERHEFKTPRGKLRITISAGVTEFSEGWGFQIDDIIEQADMALYRAKQRGRNQTCKGRRFRRLPITAEVDVEVENNVIPCRSEDISVGGMLLVTPMEIAAGTPVNLHVKLPDLEHPLTVEGTVVYCREIVTNKLVDFSRFHVGISVDPSESKYSAHVMEIVKRQSTVNNDRRR